MRLNIKLGKIKREEIKKYISDSQWQKLRVSLKNTSLETKISACNRWLELNKYSYASKIQIINYINALKRSSYSKDITKYL